MKGHWIPYSAEEMAWLEANREMVIGDYHRSFCEAFGRDDVSAVNLHSLRKRKGWLTGRTGHFAKGQAPFNKGVKAPPGKGGNHPNARRTHFRKGERHGVAAKIYKQIGAERLCKDGYRERKVHDGLPLQSRCRAVHLVEWEAIHGPVPDGMALKCLDSNKLNCDPSNWELVPRAILPRLNGGRHKKRIAYDEAPAELKPTVLAIAKLEHCARSARKRRAEP